MDKSVNTYPYMDNQSIHMQSVNTCTIRNPYMYNQSIHVVESSRATML